MWRVIEQSRRQTNKLRDNEDMITYTWAFICNFVIVCALISEPDEEEEYDG